MSTRLQVILADEEMEEIRQVARTHRMTVAEWVRQALRAARRNQPLRDRQQKLTVLRGASVHSFPTGDIQEILAEIERGYLRDEA